MKYNLKSFVKAIAEVTFTKVIGSTKAISNATWSVVILCDVLNDQGTGGNKIDGFHVEFQKGS